MILVITINKIGGNFYFDFEYNVIQIYLLRDEEFINYADSGNSDTLFLAEHSDANTGGAGSHVPPV